MRIENITLVQSGENITWTLRPRSGPMPGAAYEIERGNAMDKSKNVKITGTLTPGDIDDLIKALRTLQGK